MEMMFGYRPSAVWKLLWGFITPSLLGVSKCDKVLLHFYNLFRSLMDFYLLFQQFMVVYNAVTLTTPSYGDYQYPSWAVALGFVVAFSSIIPIPICLIYEVTNAKGPLLKVCLKSLNT